MKLRLKTLVSALGLLVCCTLPAFANLEVRFDEGAPKDYFSFQNNGNCALKDVTLILDLSSSKSGLIFDVTANGAGVEVFQPLDVVSGAQALSKLPKVKDGDNQISFDIGKLDAGEVLKFSIDVDDTAGGREITVSGSEVSGARVQLRQSSKVASGTFDVNARALISIKDCNVT